MGLLYVCHILKMQATMEQHLFSSPMLHESIHGPTLGYMAKAEERHALGSLNSGDQNGLKLYMGLAFVMGLRWMKHTLRAVLVLTFHDA